MRFGPLPHESKGEAGFSVLEALVAMALLAGAFLPLLQIQGQFVRTTESVERAQIRVEQRELARTYLATVNFTDQPAGQVTLGQTLLVWESEIAQPTRIARGVDGTPGRFFMTLYDVNVRVETANQAESGGLSANPFRFKGLGWRPSGRVVEGF